MEYIDIHTHATPTHTKAVQSLHSNFDAVQQKGWYAIGLHPWHIDANWEEQYRLVEQWATHPHVVAIGECGLDRVCAVNFQLQQQVFYQHIQLANLVHKPLIIHCVKAYDEVLKALQQTDVPAVFHGFNKSRELALQIITAGHYISFGKALLQPRVQDVLKVLPPDKIFLETDDAAVTIETIYQQAAQAFSIDENSLSLQLQKNALTVFNL